MKTTVTLLIAILISTFAVAIPVMGGTITGLTLTIDPILTVNIVGGGRVPWMSMPPLPSPPFVFGMFEDAVNTLGFVEGTGFFLTFVPDPGWEFSTATGDGQEMFPVIWPEGGDEYVGRLISDDLNLDKTVTVTFVQLPILTVNIVGGGRVPWMSVLNQVEDHGLFEGTVNTLAFDAGTGFVLGFVPDSGWMLGGATGDISNVGSFTFTWLSENGGDDVQYDGGFLAEPYQDMSSDNTVTVTFIEIPVISIDVLTPDVDFGSPVIGETVTNAIGVLNNGNVDVDVSAKLQGEDPVDFYTDNLKMDAVTVSGWSRDDLAPFDTEMVSLSLTIPDPCLPGPKTATLVFEAVASS